MSESVVFYSDRGSKIHVLSSDALRHSNELDPVVSITADLMKAGFNGVILDETRLMSGRFLQAISVNFATPEGCLVADLLERQQRGLELPDSEAVLSCIREMHNQMGGES